MESSEGVPPNSTPTNQSIWNSLWGQLRSSVYDAMIVYMTSEWYRRVLSKLPMRAHILDVGIGTGAALLQHVDTLKQHQLKITGVDIDADYVSRAQDLIQQHDVAQFVTVKQESIYDHSGGPYDAVYFSGSFMLMPDPEKCLRHISTQLKPEGIVYFTQTFQKNPSWLMESIKPLLVYVTSIDFGQVTYENTFRDCVQRAGFTLLYDEVIWEDSNRVAKLIAASP